jgi:transcription antitermination factor NusG
MSEPQWFALLTKARHEKVVRDRLAGKGIQPFLPTTMKLSQWHDRKKRIEVPLFGGYCFAHFTPQEKLEVLKVVGVLQIVGSSSGRPEAIPDAEINAIRTLMSTKLQYDSHPFLEEGMQVEVVRGPLQGLTGILLHKVRPFRLVLSINVIKQAASVEIDADDVVPIPTDAGAALSQPQFTKT